ncbi:MAG: flavodoxin family protein [Hylemonella sp.]|uniref:flavodoxin family protein n=1 Tax=Hylemonella sp. TaxID=2066020 RepID=UPI00391BE098
MKNIAVIYHSGHGNTEHFARLVVAGALSVADTHVDLLKAEALTNNPSSLLDYDAYVFGSPTYLGGVSGPFKSFIDSTGGLWRKQQLKGKLAAGFTVSALPSGDKQSTLISMFTFAMQHGMIWVGNPFLPEQGSGVPYEQALNRLGSWTGLMAQASHSASGQSYAPGDLRTAEAFGRNFAQVLARMGVQTEEMA